MSKNIEFVTYITELALGENFVEGKSGFEIYVTKGNEDLFEIAKNLHVDMEIVKKQNPNLEEYQANQHVLVYNQL